MPLPGLLGEACARPERERDGVVLVEHLVDRLREERRRVTRVIAHRLRDRDDSDAQPLAQQRLVAPRLDLVAREARGVEDEHDLEAPLGRVGHQPLELRTAVCLAPAGVEVAVLADDLQLVLGGELRDGLALCVGREALALLLGRLAHVGGRARCWRRCVSHRRAVRASAASRRPRRSHQSANQRAKSSCCAAESSERSSRPPATASLLLRLGGASWPRVRAGRAVERIECRLGAIPEQEGVFQAL